MCCFYLFFLPRLCVFGILPAQIFAAAILRPAGRFLVGPKALFCGLSIYDCGQIVAVRWLICVFSRF